MERFSWKVEVLPLKSGLVLAWFVWNSLLLLKLTLPKGGRPLPFLGWNPVRYIAGVCCAGKPRRKTNILLKTNKVARHGWAGKRKVDNPKEAWLIFKNTHEAIIDQETFDIVQKMRSHKRSNQRYKNRIGHENLFAGLVFVELMGENIIFAHKRKTD